MKFRKSKQDGAGSVVFRGTLPPRADEFGFLSTDAIKVRPLGPREGAHWALSLTHPEHGEATLVCLKDAPTPPRWVVEYSVGLTPGEREEVLAGGSMVSVRYGAPTGDVLRDRKALLWYLRRVMGDDGVGAMDHLSQRFWSREGLDLELSHDAPLDVESLFVVHAITGSEVPPAGKAAPAESDEEASEPARAHWLHTHGLAELGAFDFDILDPSSAASGDCLRSLACAALEGRVGPSTGAYRLAEPGGTIRMVPAAEFMRSAAPHWRDKRDADPDHNTNRSVVCDPVRGLGKLMGGKPRPSRFFMRDDIDQCVFGFSDEATHLMSERARLTLGLCARLREELAEFGFTCLMKIGYPADGGGREHLWFEVHDLRPGAVDATLVNRPFNIAALSEGQRGTYSLEDLTDWQIMTPLGSISPRETAIARRIQESPDAAREMMNLVKLMQSMGLG